MKISVITPTLNSEKTIEKNIKSVIKQSYTNFEHIIIDSLSTDKTLNIVKELYNKSNLSNNLRIITEKDDGISEAFNKGINFAKGDIITILNSDDYYYSDSVFEEVINSFGNKLIQFTHGDVLFVDELYGTNIRKPLMCDLRQAMPYNHPTMFVRKELYNRVGWFNKDFKYAMDFDFICRIKNIYCDLNSISFYMLGKPITVMQAGGASWINEIKSLQEVKDILSQNGLWDNKARLYFLLRILRVKIKTALNSLGLVYIVKMWRKIKWKTNR